MRGVAANYPSVRFLLHRKPGRAPQKFDQRQGLVRLERAAVALIAQGVVSDDQLLFGVVPVEFRGDLLKSVVTEYQAPLTPGDDIGYISFRACNHSARCNPRFLASGKLRGYR